MISDRNNDIKNLFVSSFVTLYDIYGNIINANETYKYFYNV